MAGIGFLFLLWLIWGSCRKFARDSAQLAEEEEGNSIGTNAPVKNRVGRTATLLQKNDDIDYLISEHSQMTMVESNESRKRGNCCTNCFRMWSYRKIVTQEEQYLYNLRKIEEWKSEQAQKVMHFNLTREPSAREN